MKIKIIILMILIIISINNVSGNDEIGTGDFSISGTSKSEYTSGYLGAYNVHYNSIFIKDVGTLKEIKRIQISIDMDEWNGGSADAAWYNIQYRDGSINGAILGNGTVGYSKGVSSVYVTAYFHDGLSGSGSKTLLITTAYGASMPAIIKTLHFASKLDEIGDIKDTDALFYASQYYYIISNIETDTYYDIDFYNSYNWTNNVSINQLGYNQIRDSGNKTKTKITVNDTIYYQDTSFKDTELNYLHPFYDSDIWNINIENQYGDIKNFDISFDLPDDTQPTLTTDKTYYNTSEIITINYTNIQTIYDDCTGYDYDSKCVHPYELYILYPIYSDNIYNQWGAKYQMYLPYYYDTDGSGIKYDDGSITLNTSILSPQNTYVIALLGKNGYYGKTDDIQLFSDSFTVYPANEYLNTNCEGRSVYVGTDIIIYYKIDNTSKIIIKDNDENIINEFYNIINEGELIYNIPGDLDHLNTYPNWKIYLNNTDYATSYNKDLEVYWSLFETPTETPTPYPTSTPDINITDQLDNLTIEIQPIKDLIFGLVYIVIDNPDYDKDNIIDENEINHWFNSLIPICLLFLLIIIYIGLKKNRD